MSNAGHMAGEPQSHNDRGLELLGEDPATGEDSFRALFENAPDAILVEDYCGKVLDVNPAACRLHQMSREELLGLGASDLVPPEYRAEAMAGFHALVNGETDSYNANSYTKHGEVIPVCVRASRIQYRGGPALLFHVSDVTEQRLLEDQLRQSQKMEAIGRLAGGIAHDFNNLLTAILGYTELSQAALEADHEIQGDLEEVKQAGEEAASLTRQLLAFSRQQVLEPAVKDLNEIVRNVENLCRRTIGEDIKLTTRLANKLRRVRVDEGQLEQVILNLIVNSRDAMPEGGQISIETKDVTIDRDHAARRVPLVPGEYVALTVTDTGCGMSHEVLEQVFDPFFTTKGPDEGTGLGLSTVYGIIKQSGGFVFVDSELGSGASVQILLPPTEPEEDTLAPSSACPELSAGNRTILLTEDNKVVRELSAQVLEEMGHQVLATESAEEALGVIEGKEHSIDLLVTDLVLAGMDGLTLARKLLAVSQETRVLLMSGHSRRARFNPEAPLEGTDFLQKPFTPAKLKLAVVRALQRPLVEQP